MKRQKKINKHALAEVWNDIVMIRELLISIVLCTIGAMGGYLLAPQEPPMPLLFGFVGIGISFVLCNILSKPKRILIHEQEESDAP